MNTVQRATIALSIVGVVFLLATRTSGSIRLYEVLITVSDGQTPVSGATVSIAGIVVQTNAQGQAVISNLAGGNSYQLRITVGSGNVYAPYVDTISL